MLLDTSCQWMDLIDTGGAAIIQTIMKLLKYFMMAIKVFIWHF